MPCLVATHGLSLASRFVVGLTPTVPYAGNRSGGGLSPSQAHLTQTMPSLWSTSVDADPTAR